MTPAAIVGLVVQTLGLGAEALERVFAAHPELRDPPPAPADTEIDARIDARLREREVGERPGWPTPMPAAREGARPPGHYLDKNVVVVTQPAPEASAEVQDAVYPDDRTDLARSLGQAWCPLCGEAHSTTVPCVYLPPGG